MKKTESGRFTKKVNKLYPLVSSSQNQSHRFHSISTCHIHLHYGVTCYCIQLCYRRFLHVGKFFNFSPKKKQNKTNK